MAVHYRIRHEEERVRFPGPERAQTRPQLLDRGDEPLDELYLELPAALRASVTDCRAAVKAKEKGAGGGGIRIVLPNPVVDPLLRPGQEPRPLRLLEQDPSKPLPHATGTSTKQPASSGPVPSLPLAPNPQAKFDPIELVEDFEHPICQLCLSLGMVRDENGIKMVTCDYCGAPGQRRPRKETDEDGIEMVMCEERSLPGVYAYLRNATCT